MMRAEKNSENGLEPSSPHASRILSGLRRQREELGSIADELIELLRRHGVAEGVDVYAADGSRRDSCGGAGHA